MPVLSTLGAAIANVYGFTSGLIKDQYFNLVSLLLPGNGTNGAQNNTFLDSSNNTFTITRNGNTTQGTFSPFSQTGWGGSFDGSNDYVTVPYSTTDFDWFTAGQDFTLEAWVYPTSLSTWQDGSAAPMLIGNGEPGGNYWSFGPLSNGTVRLYYYNGTGVNVTSTATVTANQWNHIAMTKTSSGITIYVNGSGTTATAISGTPQSGTAIPLSIGRAGSSYINGYVSNLRILKNVTPPYSGTSYTVPTAPLTNVSGTKLLTLQSNRFVDNSSSPRTITVYNGAAITPFSPFAPTQSYSAAAVGGSGYFDGNTDYLSVANQTALQLSGSQFTIEGWFYFTTSGVDNYIVVQSSALADANVNWLVRVTSGNKLRVLLMTSGATAVSFDGSTTVTANSWHHFAATCDGTGAGSNVRSWLDGVYQGGTTVNTANINTNTAATQIGGWSFASSYSTGYVSGLRILKGTALYTGTSDITVPTSPPTAITNTSLLLNFTNAGVVDATAKNVLETVGNAQISTTQSKWGGGSMYFNGSSSYLMGAANQQYEFGSGDFTVECWVNISAAASDAGIVGKGPVGSVNNTIWSIEFVGTGNTIGFYVPAAAGSFIITGTTNMKTSTWIHVAVCKSGNNTRLFINGTQEGSTYTTGYTISAGNNLYVGGGFYAPTTRTITGYVDDLRFTKFARYTANFTPPTAPFPVQ